MKEKELIKIREVANILNVSLDTLRRWDKSRKLKSIRLTPNGHRYYKIKEIKMLTKDIFSLAQNWISQKNPEEPISDFYCPDSATFQLKLRELEIELQKIPDLEGNFSLVTASVGEIGNNSFDHNTGAWTDIRGIFFSYDINKRQIALADRGQGILRTLQRVRSELLTDKEALKVAFTEKVTGRAPEQRGNGLKFVKLVITELLKSEKINLYFQSGNAFVELKNETKNLEFQETKESVRGCLALINF